MKVVSVSTQHNLKTVGGYDPKLDLLAEDEEERLISRFNELRNRIRFYGGGIKVLV